MAFEALNIGNKKSPSVYAFLAITALVSNNWIDPANAVHGSRPARIPNHVVA
jgi:hypothetical protein